MGANFLLWVHLDAFQNIWKKQILALLPFSPKAWELCQLEKPSCVLLILGVLLHWQQAERAGVLWWHLPTSLPGPIFLKILPLPTASLHHMLVWSLLHFMRSFPQITLSFWCLLLILPISSDSEFILSLPTRIFTTFSKTPNFPSGLLH